ncbi:DEAD/DEAH box helicase [Clostridium perfringens]|uniref:DEAD/DEAH box helicase n=1 Tax=Clostridium perfringens TaxID=1502 RepID=UPI0039E8BCD8
MNLDILMKNLVRRTSSFTREQGKKLIKEAYVKDVRGKSIDGIYHIYGSVLNDDKNWDYNTHIKINMKNSDIVGTNCSCETFKENSKHIKNYVCKHISATNDVFYSLAKKKMQNNKLKSNNKTQLVKEKNEEHKGQEKRFLSLDINIKHMVKEGITLFNCEFRIGAGNLNLILDLKDFLYKNSLKKPLKFNDGFTYNPLKDEFLEEDKRVLQFVASHKDMISGRYLRIKQNNLKDFLKLVDEKKKINFNFNSINYEVKVKKENVPQEIVGKLLNKEFKRKLVPRALNAELRPYQKEGFKWINEITDLGFGGVLADDMGLGKTLQIIAFLLSQKKSKSIVVVPTSVIYNWMDEFEKFAPSIKIGLVHGSKSKRDKVLRDFKRGLGIKVEEENLKEKSYEKYDVLLTTYGTLKNDEKAYENLSFDYCIIDEAQNIKNPAAQATLSVKNIKSRCNIALTGTPIENNLMELWSIFDFVMPGYLFTKDRFRERFILDESNLSELKSLITPFILRRLKEDVLSELPEKLEKKYLVEMKGKQKQLYSFYVKAIKNQLNENKSSEKSGRDKINLFSYLTKLREICLDPSLVVPDYTGGSSKLTVVKEIVKDASESGKKILLFSQFTSVLQKIEEDFKKEDISYLYLDGGTSAKDRVERVKKFNEDSNIKVFLISLKAGGVGLNLTSASMVIHFDPWWNPAVEDQATDRAHRFGQENKVEVIKLVAKDTIEEKIVLMQEDKRELIQSLMDGKTMDGKGLKRLTEEEISKLFE